MPKFIEFKANYKYIHFNRDLIHSICLLGPFGNGSYSIEIKGHISISEDYLDLKEAENRYFHLLQLLND